ncbi:MAG TPA: SCO family protein [Vicinamibacterales bacterium]|nr:SCO family protein [Vicinamibacterales bacterium]
MKRAAACLLAASLCTAAPAYAQYAAGPQRPNPVNQKPEILKNVGIDQKIGQQLPLDLTFKNEAGRDVRLGEFFTGRPVVLALAYYDCPMLCTQVLNGMTGALKTLSFDAGRDFEVVVVSIDPRDNFQVAAHKKASYVEHYGRPQTAAGWHFLTGAESAIKPLADALGFRYVYDANIKQYAHGAAIYVATPKGVVSRYLLGIDFAPRDLRLALVEASNNVLGSVVDQVLLLCYHYDPTTGKYGAATINAVRIGFLATVTGFLAFLFVSLKRERLHGHGADTTARTSAAREREGEPAGRRPSDIA